MAPRRAGSQRPRQPALSPNVDADMLEFAKARLVDATAAREVVDALEYRGAQDRRSRSAARVMKATLARDEGDVQTQISALKADLDEGGLSPEGQVTVTSWLCPLLVEVGEARAARRRLWACLRAIGDHGASLFLMGELAALGIQPREMRAWEREVARCARARSVEVPPQGCSPSQQVEWIVRRARA
jgi:hypothetical protein